MLEISLNLNFFEKGSYRDESCCPVSKLRSGSPSTKWLVPVPVLFETLEYQDQYSQHQYPNLVVRTCCNQCPWLQNASVSVQLQLASAAVAAATVAVCNSDCDSSWGCLESHRIQVTYEYKNFYMITYYCITTMQEQYTQVQSLTSWFTYSYIL